MTDTRYLTSDNVALRPSNNAHYLVDIRTEWFALEIPRTIGMIFSNYDGTFDAYSWQVGNTIVASNVSIHDATHAIVASANPYTFR